MGRPEKAKHRKLTGSPHCMFPCGQEGGRLRSFNAALDTGFIDADFQLFYCSKCDNETILTHCEKCGSKTINRYVCVKCGKHVNVSKHCGSDCKVFDNIKLDFRNILNSLLTSILIA